MKEISVHLPSFQNAGTHNSFPKAYIDRLTINAGVLYHALTRVRDADSIGLIGSSKV